MLRNWRNTDILGKQVTIAAVNETHAQDPLSFRRRKLLVPAWSPAPARAASIVGLSARRPRKAGAAAEKLVWLTSNYPEKFFNAAEYNGSTAITQRLW